MGCLGIVANADYATDDIPSDLPPGTYRIMDGVYATPIENMPQTRTSYFPMTNIGTVPGYGSIVQPYAFHNITIDNSAQKYIHVKANDYFKINFVENELGGQNVFGTNIAQWPTVSSSYVISIQVSHYNMKMGTSYQLQCSSATDAPCTGNDGNGVKISIYMDGSSSR